MSRFEANRAAEMEVFVRIVALGGLTPAARDVGLTPSAISKLMSRLERRLGARLLNRSTRRLQLTPEGRAFYDRAVAILADLDEAERAAAAGARPAGHLTVNSNIPFGMRYVLQLTPKFLARYPEVTIDVVLSDTVVDLMEARADVAIRVGPLEPSSLIARKLGSSRMVVVASPDYLARRGAPKTPAELLDHVGVGWTFPRLISGWPFLVGSTVQSVSPPPIARASDGEAARLLALGGVGLARLARFHVDPDIAEGRLTPVLEDLNPGDREDIHVIYQGARGPLPARVRAFIDFLAEHVRIDA
ncbi:LysR family transcriptional regulator [Phenylobacterium sp.]|uniref:LysR family transcriptional regulator n=1 Tax=Phenylobacterium sp. TaxID=1871053 RepID=UPI0035AEAD99